MSDRFIKVSARQPGHSETYDVAINTRFIVAIGADVAGAAVVTMKPGIDSIVTSEVFSKLIVRLPILTSTKENL